MFLENDEYELCHSSIFFSSLFLARQPAIGEQVPQILHSRMFERTRYSGCNRVI